MSSSETEECAINLVRTEPPTVLYRQKKTFSPYQLFMSIVRYKLFMLIVHSEGRRWLLNQVQQHIRIIIENLTWDDVKDRALLLVWEKKDDCERRKGMQKRLYKYIPFRKLSLLCKNLWCSLSLNEKVTYETALDLARVHPIRYIGDKGENSVAWIVSSEFL